jgi:hypothetical protein
MEAMPTLRNIKSNNLIPVIDFEAFNSNEEVTDLHYLIVYGEKCLRTLPIESAASQLF